VAIAHTPFEKRVLSELEALRREVKAMREELAAASLEVGGVADELDARFSRYADASMTGYRERVAALEESASERSSVRDGDSG
jgi:hypothetical protein